MWGKIVWENNRLKEIIGMKIIIVGDGKVGLTLTEQLSVEGHDLVVIDSNAEVLQDSLETFDVMVVNGNGASLSVLQQAGVQEADLLIAATSLDEINLLSCMTAKKMGCGRTIARVRNPEYKEQVSQFGPDFGISLVINPEEAAAREIYHTLQFPSSIKREFFARSKIELVELKIPADSPVVGQPLTNLYRLSKLKVLVCAVDRNGEVFIPGGDFILRESDIIYVTSETAKLAALIKFLGIETQKIRDVMIIGGGQIAYYLAQRLASSNINLKIIEKDYEKCVRIAEHFPKALVIHGDGSGYKLLEKEGIGKMDSVISLIGIDEFNMIISMYAQNLNVQKVITKIDRTENFGIFKKLGMESIVCPKLIVCNDVLRYVRAMNIRTEKTLRTLLRLLDGRVEALEFIAAEDTMYLNTPLKKVSLIPETLVACVVHKGKVLFPGGEDHIEHGDYVIIISAAKNRVKKLNDIFVK